jgi:hypothetical protein
MACDAQECFPILPSLWQLSTNKTFNTHSETSNFAIGKTLHEVGIGFCWSNQTHQHVYWKQKSNPILVKQLIMPPSGWKQRHYAPI